MLNVFLFFPPVESTLISFGCLSYGGYYYLNGEALLPHLTPNTFNVQFHRICKNMKTKRLGMKAIRATHTQREQLSLSWISFSLKTLHLSPFGLAGSGFSLPGASPVRKSANETTSGSRLFECVARVKAFLDFLLAQSTPPAALWACRLRFFVPLHPLRHSQLKMWKKRSQTKEHHLCIES